MAQADLNVANQSGSAFRADLNSQLLALGTLMSGASEPSTTYAYMLWADTTASVLKMRNAANNGWVILRGLEGKLSVGSSAPGANVNLRLNRDIAGATTSFGQYVDAEVAATVTASAIGIGTSLSTAASTSLGSLIHYQAATGTLGAGTSITNQIGFSASSSIDGATNDFGFYGNIAAGSGNWNCYMVGAAPSFFNHQVQINAGSAGTPSLSTNGDTDTGIHFPAANSLGFATGGTERMRLTSTGLGIGIGVTGPANVLDVVTATSGDTAPVKFTRGGAGGSPGYLYSDGGGAGIYNGGLANAGIYMVSNDHIDFRVNGGERARIDSSGRLLVGTSSSRDKWFNAAAWGNPTFQLETAVSVTSVASIVNNANDDGPGALFLAKSRAGSVGGVTVVNNNDIVGRIAFQGADGTEMVAAAMIEAQVDGTPGANDMPGRLVFSTTADGASSPTERMRVSADGLVRTYGDGNSIIAASAQSAGTTFATFICRHSASSTTTGTTSFQVMTNGNAQNTNNSYGAISDIKLKENIVDATSQWDDIKSLQVRKYNFKEGQTHTQIGLIAQEVELVSPGLVSESPDRDAEGNDLGTVTKSVNYSVLYMKAVKALQEAMERIETLEAKVAALEGA